MCTEQYGGPEQALITGTFQRPPRLGVRLGHGTAARSRASSALSFLVPGFGTGAAA